MIRQLYRQLLALVAIVTLLAMLGSFSAWRIYSGFLHTPLTLPQSGQVFQIQPGSSVRTIAADLENLGVIDSALLFRWYTRMEDKSASLQAGEYRLTPELTPVSLLGLLTSGKTVSYSLTLVEGWNFKEMMGAIGKHTVLKHTLEGLSGQEIMSRLGYPEEHPEGRFFPDTYLFPKGSTDLELLQRAYQRMQQVLVAQWVTRAEFTPLKTPYEALILASIVEKETGVPEERPEIAGVFVRRLQKGMKLQTDPTVIYGMGENFQGNIRRKDLRQDTPYNTYVHQGLPPTPICMPGELAIKAALNPKDGKSLYFVAKGNGAHQFSATLKQHNAAVRKYQLKK